MTDILPIPFGEWLPDLPDHENEGALTVKNVLPGVKSAFELKSPLAFSDALTGACLGSFWAQDDSNAVFNFAGDNTKLYELSNSNSWTDVSGASAPFSATRWEFTKFGDRVIAVSITDPTQKYDVSSDSAFSALAGSPPQAACIATIRDFVMVGDVSALGPNFVQWCGFNNSELWTPSLATQSDYQELFGRGGRVLQIVPGEYGLVFMEQSIFMATYEGPPVIFRFDEVEKQRGTPCGRSVVWSGRNVWFYGWDDFYYFNGEDAPVGIGANRIAKWFQQNADPTAYSTMNAVVDRVNRLIIWAFKSTASAATNNRLLIYNWAADKWAFAEVDTELIGEYVAPGLNLDELDTPLPSGIDADSIPVESRQFLGGDIGVQVFDSAHKAGTFSGDPLTAVLDTTEISGSQDMRLITTGVRPQVEGSGATAITVSVGTRNRLQDSPDFSIPKSLNSIGEANMRVNSRYQRYRLNISGGFLHGSGVRARITQQGGKR